MPGSSVAETRTPRGARHVRLPKLSSDVDLIAGTRTAWTHLRQSDNRLSRSSQVAAWSFAHAHVAPSSADLKVVATRLSLRYPNGRSHEVALDQILEPGQEFELYGRRWVVVGRLPGPRNVRQPPRFEPPLLCHQVNGRNGSS